MKATLEMIFAKSARLNEKEMERSKTSNSFLGETLSRFVSVTVCAMSGEVKWGLKTLNSHTNKTSFWRKNGPLCVPIHQY